MYIPVMVDQPGPNWALAFDHRCAAQEGRFPKYDKDFGEIWSIRLTGSSPPLEARVDWYEASNTGASCEPLRHTGSYSIRRNASFRRRAGDGDTAVR